MKIQRILIGLLIILNVTFLIMCSSENTSEEAQSTDVQSFLDDYTNESLKLIIVAGEAAWKLNTEIYKDDTTNAYAATMAEEAYAAYTGSEENINIARKYLEDKESLTDLQIKQLEVILYAAANNPATIPDVVSARIKAETQQTEDLYGFTFMLNGDTITTNEIDKILREEKDLDVRLEAWEASKEVGVGLKPGLENLRDLRNETVQALGYDDYFAYQVSDYGMTTDEMLALTDQLIEEVWPLYRELHTYARYELAEMYGVDEVPDMLPAHWLPNRWGQDWASMVEVEGLNLDSIIGTKSKEWIVEQGERFYVSLGFPELPEVFWQNSSLYPLPENAGYSKNNHASAWHMDYKQDVRSLMSIEPDPSWYETSHHELGHIYYYLTYANEDVPILLRGGANRGFHEAFGSMMGLAAMQKPFLAELGLLPENAETDDLQILLKEALNYIILIPWGAGVMTDFEHELYSNNLPVDQFNAKWWEIKKNRMGIVPPTERGEEFCDAASKTHINNDPAQYYDYAISYILLFQFHDHIAKNILKQDPHATNYYGSKEVGDFLRDVMYPGASIDWREMMELHLGEGISAKPMLEYFEPLLDHLKEVNKGRKYTL
ncbi:MAG: M2 family metallopeptidase [Bacteroidetes bacterium]|nr:M2 family metallopeptidase [Bacteroidota bacterium]